jgi:hypothetical protein
MTLNYDDLHDRMANLFVFKAPHLEAHRRPDGACDKRLTCPQYSLCCCLIERVGCRELATIEHTPMALRKGTRDEFIICGGQCHGVIPFPDTPSFSFLSWTDMVTVLLGLACDSMVTHL